MIGVEDIFIEEVVVFLPFHHLHRPLAEATDKDHHALVPWLSMQEPEL